MNEVCGRSHRSTEAHDYQWKIPSQPEPHNTMSRFLQSLVLLTLTLRLWDLQVVSAEEAIGIKEAPITSTDREHWSFQPLVRPKVPAVSDERWPQTPIDRFILARLEAKELAPQPLADRATLLRRLCFDLIGLPPSPEQIDRFVADPSEQAITRVIDELLASPQYGERWAQHWLDLARFAETDGFEHDKVRRDAWKYRDWVIDALNADMPYDRFVRLQLAADEIEPDNQAGFIATVFCLAGPDMPDINSQDERRHQLLNELTSSVGGVLLGLQLGCAQCHDHKYDPVSIADFYRLRAVFEPAVQLKKNESVSTLVEKKGAVPTSYVMLRGDWRQRGPQVEPAFPRVANIWDEQVSQADKTTNTSGRRKALANWVTRKDHPLTSRVIANRIWQFHFGEGLSRTPSDFGLIGDAPSHPELLDWLAVELVEDGWNLKHLHRLICNSAVYQHASRPPDGIDAEKNAVEKNTHVMTNWEKALTVDSKNFYLSRFPRQRLTGETLRDALLAVSGTLESKHGGPSALPPLPSEVVRMLLKDQWKPSQDPAEHFRRSIYVFARRNLRYPIFEAYDRPDGNASCPQRSRSTTAPQSLLLLNSELSLDLARRFAGKVLREAPANSEERISLAIRSTYGRQATFQEVTALTSFLESQEKILESESRPVSSMATPVPCPPGFENAAGAAWTDLCLALLNSSEFLYVD